MGPDGVKLFPASLAPRTFHPILMVDDYCLYPPTPTLLSFPRSFFILGTLRVYLFKEFGLHWMKVQKCFCLFWIYIYFFFCLLLTLFQGLSDVTEKKKSNKK